MNISIFKKGASWALLILIGLSGCGDPVGVYVGYYCDGNETIALNSDGTYRQTFYYKGNFLYSKTNTWKMSSGRIVFRKFHSIKNWHEVHNGLRKPDLFDLFLNRSITNKSGIYIGRPLLNKSGNIYVIGKHSSLAIGGDEDFLKLKRVK
jgi:hypothetical protein